MLIDEEYTVTDLAKDWSTLVNLRELDRDYRKSMR